MRAGYPLHRRGILRSSDISPRHRLEELRGSHRTYCRIPHRRPYCCPKNAVPMMLMRVSSIPKLSGTRHVIHPPEGYEQSSALADLLAMRTWSALSPLPTTSSRPSGQRGAQGTTPMAASSFQAPATLSQVTRATSPTRRAWTPAGHRDARGSPAFAADGGGWWLRFGWLR